MIRLSVTAFLFVGSLLLHVGWGLCPSQCQCDDTRLKSDCSDAKLEVVPIFLNPSIRHLEANRNQIKHLEGALKVYSDLETLDLSHNEFHSLGQRQFENLDKLHLLNLSNNFVSSLHVNTFEGPTALQTLDLSHNILSTIFADTFRGLEDLVELRLSFNKIKEFPLSAFNGLSRLRVLYLDHNLIETVNPMWMIQLENLRFFYLSNNRIKTLEDESFRPLSALKVLSVVNNQISSISQAAFRGLRSLDTIDLSFNQLSRVPNSAMSQLQQLQRLHLSGNPIIQIVRESFQSLFTLEDLFLDRMPDLVAIDGHALIDNTKLKSLSLENNEKLRPLPWGVFATNGLLQDVSFRNNTWTSLSVHQIPQQSLRRLYLSGLPFHCNCSLIWLWELYQRQNETRIELDGAHCNTRPSGSSDPRNAGNDLFRMSPDQLSCDDFTHVLVIVSASIIGVILTIFVAALCLYKFRNYRLKEKYGTPCFHIKDDTMIYRGTLGSPIEPFKTLTASDPEASGSYSPTEPFYEVPKYGDEDPKSSSASSGSKYSSSGYVGSELWENEFFSNTTPTPIVHCYVNPNSNPTASPSVMLHSRTLQRNYGGSPQGSSGMGSTSGTSTGSNGSARHLISNGRPHNFGLTNTGSPCNHQTLMWMSASPSRQNADKFSTGNFRHHENLIDTHENIVMPNTSPNPVDQRNLSFLMNSRRELRNSPKDSKIKNFRTNVYV